MRLVRSAIVATPEYDLERHGAGACVAPIDVRRGGRQACEQYRIVFHPNPRGLMRPHPTARHGTARDRVAHRESGQRRALRLFGYEPIETVVGWQQPTWKLGRRSRYQDQWRVGTQLVTAGTAEFYS